jgi:hypothetical protein
MAADTRIAISLETRADLDEVARQLRTEQSGWAISMDMVIRQLLADRADLRKIREES